MKRYICKEDLINRLEKEVGVSEKLSSTFVKDMSTIEGMLTITKAEIIQEFTDKLIDYFMIHAHEVYNHVSARDFICDKIIALAEKGQGEMKKGETMCFPNTVDEFMEQYKMVDSEQIYSNGIEYVPIFRMKQWFEEHPAVTKGDVLNEFEEWLKIQIAGIDNNKNQILVVRQDRWEEAVETYLAEIGS